jgi:integrase/recombinase XerD
MGTRQRKRDRAPKNLYQRDGVFYARITVENREHRRSLKTRDRAEAERRLSKWLSGVSPYKGTVRHTFKEAAALWFTAGEWKPKTMLGYAKLLKILDAHFGEKFWDQVDKAALQDFAQARRDAGAGTATINRYLSVVSGIAEHVRELPGWPEINPVNLLPKKPRREKRKAYVRPPAEDIEAFFARMHGTFGDLCRFALLTGARKDEIATLRQVDARGGKAQLWETKSKFRVITLNPEATALVEKQPRGEFVFCTRNGGPYRRVTEMWREVVVRAQKMAQQEGRSLTRLRFHDLRHEFAIRYLENGGSLYTLQLHLGHSSIKQTEAYLRFLTPEKAAQVSTATAQ